MLHVHEGQSENLLRIADVASVLTMAKSILDDLGEEVTGIVSPVSLCMALTVALVRVLNPTGDTSGNTTYFASAYYREQV